MGVFLFSLCAAVGTARQVIAQSAAPGPAVLRGVLVLHNGSVLVGAVRRSGDDYVVDQAGATLQVRADQVERFAASLNEVYEARRRDCASDSAEDHLKLAAWCLQLDLLDYAARELLDVRTIDAQLPGLPAVEAQLRQIVDLKAVRLASHDEPAARAPRRAVESAAPPEAPPELAPDLSANAQIQFVRSIQPMLVRNCSTSGCHQKGAAHGMQLDRWALEGSGNAESVRRNLEAVLRELDRDAPAESAVLRFGRAVHGKETSAGSRPLTPRQGELLLEWLNAAAGVEPEPIPPTHVEGEPFSGDVAGEWESQNDEPRAAKFAPRDAFDPEVFNRRQAKRREAVESSVDEVEDAVDDDIGMDEVESTGEADEFSSPAPPDRP